MNAYYSVYVLCDVNLIKGVAQYFYMLMLSIFNLVYQNKKKQSADNMYFKCDFVLCFYKACTMDL